MQSMVEMDLSLHLPYNNSLKILGVFLVVVGLILFVFYSASVSLAYQLLRQLYVSPSYVG